MAMMTNSFDSGSNSINYDSRAVSDYTVYISGGSGTAIIPIDITASGSASASSSTDAGAEASLAINNNNQDSACAGGDTTRFCTPTSFAGMIVYNAFSVHGAGSFTVDLTADAWVDSRGGSASATLDPFIQIDPSFLAANPGYSLSFSAGVTNQPSSTPEPSTLLLLGTGLAGLTGLRRRRLM